MNNTVLAKLTEESKESSSSLRALSSQAILGDVRN